MTKTLQNFKTILKTNTQETVYVCSNLSEVLAGNSQKDSIIHDNLRDLTTIVLTPLCL